MKIAFIWPHANTVYQTIPISFGVLYANIRDQNHTARVFNLPLEGWTASSPEFEAAIAAYQPDLVCMSAWAISFKSTVAAAKVIRRVAPGATVLLGGNYPTLCPEEAWAAGCFDYLLRGEAELAFAQFVRLFAEGRTAEIAQVPGIWFKDEAGQLVKVRHTFVHDLDQLGTPDYEFIELERAYQRGYMRTVLGPKRKLAMFATRGCEHACHFCTAPLMNGQALRHYSTKVITDQILHVYRRYGVRMIYFMDDNATQDRAFFVELCRAIAALELPDLELELYRGVRLENLDAPMLAAMKAAGFWNATIAPESGSERIRRQLMNKDMSREDVVRVARLIREAGLSLQAYFMIGYPGETAEDRLETYRFIDLLRPDVVSLHKYQALPGSVAFKKLVRSGKIDRYHTDESHLIGESLPNYNGDLPADIDREILGVYVRLYGRRPWAVRHLFRMASARGLRRSLGGTARAGLKAMVGLGRADSVVHPIRESM
jgi:anaerobic magnesium-protoporphyrin IX monomethyl ester cyclase